MSPPRPEGVSDNLRVNVCVELESLKMSSPPPWSSQLPSSPVGSARLRRVRRPPSRLGEWETREEDEGDEEDWRKTTLGEHMAGQVKVRISPNKKKKMARRQENCVRTGSYQAQTGGGGQTVGGSRSKDCVGAPQACPIHQGAGESEAGGLDGQESQDGATRGSRAWWRSEEGFCCLIFIHTASSCMILMR